MLEWKSRYEVRKYQNTESARIGLNEPFNVFNYPGKISSLQQATGSEEHGWYSIQKSIREYERTFGKTIKVKDGPDVVIPKRLSTVADIGGPFSSTRYSYKEGALPVNLQSGSATTSVERRFKGTLQAYSYDGAAWPTVTPATNAELYAYGNKARSLIDPTNPATSVGQGMGELRTPSGVPGIPGAALLKSRAEVFKNLGSEYLNIQFGWDPFVSDIRAAASAAKETIQLLRQYEQNRGRAVRRRYEFPTVVSDQSFSMGSKTPSPPISSAFYDTYNGTLVRRETSTHNVWFSGAFTYYVTPGMNASDLAKYEAAADRLLGSRLTPELVWNLTPWTWLTDWFVGIGDFITNLQAMILDGSVMWYGYVMSHKHVSHLYSLAGYRLKSTPSPWLWQEFNAEVKQRVRATPFGFGLSPDTEFSMKQWSILAALGISRT